jgi:hypothetical protein
MNTNEAQKNDHQIEQLTDLEPQGEVVGGHSSGGAAGGIVSEGQGYGLFIGAGTSTASTQGGSVPIRTNP